MEDYHDILFLLLGWFLGLIGGPIAEAIARHYRSRKLVPALKAELVELQHVMVLLAYNLTGFLGALDDDLVSWARPLIDSYGTAPKADKRPLAIYRATLDLPVVQQNQGLRRKTESAAKGPVTYSLPLLDAHIGSLSDLPIVLQRRLLAVREQLTIYNQKADQLSANLALSFDESIKGANRASLQSNIDGGYSFLARRARLIADAISEVLATAS